jgi:1-aminocyclopropane-1-carboxylate deaminase/D-cysteine desulfhydrase-like pyridoxal-dependent ACC family enzyme
VGTLTAPLPRLRLAHLPTPLDRAERLGGRLGLGRLWVKREDLSGLAFGGNKARQLEFIMAQLVAEGADTVVTTAGAQSNFCRATAAAAARLGLRCVLLLRGAGAVELSGNLLLDALLGAEIHWIATTDPYAAEVRERLEALMAVERAAGRRPYLVQLPGPTGPLAAAAAADLGDELLNQSEGPVRAIVLAVGSGLTAAGLLLACAARDVATRIVGISVQQPAGFIRPLILSRAQKAAELLGLRARIDEASLVLDDRFIGEGYGVASPQGLEALALAARTEGLILDPAYTAKALAGLIGHAGEGRLGSTDDVVFVHSGGGPGFFAHSAAVARAVLGAD